MSVLISARRTLWACVSVAAILGILGQGHHLNAAATQVYWADVAAQKIQRADVDGTGIQGVARLEHHAGSKDARG